MADNQKFGLAITKALAGAVVAAMCTLTTEQERLLSCGQCPGFS